MHNKTPPVPSLGEETPWIVDGFRASHETNVVDADDDGDEAHRIAFRCVEEARRACGKVQDQGKDVEGTATCRKRWKSAKTTRR